MRRRTDSCNWCARAALCTSTSASQTRHGIGVSNMAVWQVVIAVLAAVATSGDYDDLINTPNLATVATTGAYSDLSGRPNLATVATTGVYGSLTGRPTLGTMAAIDHTVLTQAAYDALTPTGWALLLHDIDIMALYIGDTQG